MVDRVAARAAFDGAIAANRAGRDGEALAKFQAATEADPGMADAWLGRIIHGEITELTLSSAFEAGAELRNEAIRKGVRLEPDVAVGPYMVITISEAFHVGIALAARYVEDKKFDKAAEILEKLRKDPAAQVGWQWQWHQHVRTYLMYATQRWPDVIREAAQQLPPEAIFNSSLSAANAVFAAMAAASLGQSRVALDWADKADTDNEVLLAELAYIRGMVYRQLDEPGKANEWLGKASINGMLIDPAKHALKAPGVMLNVVDEQEISTRTDPWDVATQKSRQDQDKEARREKHRERLSEAEAILDKQIGLSEVKDQVHRLKASAKVNKRRLELGYDAVIQGHHCVFSGPPGTGKTTIARVVASIYCALGILPDTGADLPLVQAKRADLVAEYEGWTAPKTNAKVDEALGGVLFIDEAYTLVQERDGRADPFGQEAVDTLLARMEDDRDRLVVIIAGYDDLIDRFLESNEGFASRFTRRIRFPSYTPEELRQIAVAMAADKQTTIEPAATELLERVCTSLSTQQWLVGEKKKTRPALDRVGNGRFMRNVVEGAFEEQFVRIANDIDTADDDDVESIISTLTKHDVEASLKKVLSTAGLSEAEASRIASGTV